jgi:fibronectin-binding autotransporter adhesin
MKQKNRVPLFVEPLEDRWVPATVRLLDGSLFISNPLITMGSSSIALTATNNNVFSVTDNGASLGTYNVGGNIYITGGNAKDVIRFDLAGHTYSGNLFVNSGNGNDTVSVQGTGGGTISGNVSVLPGLGNDSVGIAALGGGLTLSGSVQVTNTAGNDSVQLGNAAGATTVGGDVTLTNVPNVAIGAGSADVLNGSLSINDSQANTGVNVTLGTAATGIVINNNFNLTAGAGNDTLTVNSTTINGSANVNLQAAGGASSDSINFAGIGDLVSGNLNVQAGSASTTITTNTGMNALTVQGNAAFNLGDGNDNFLPTGDLNVAGNLNVTLGNGTDTVNLGTAASILSGNVYVNLGNGSDTVTAPALIGGSFNYRSGNGSADLLTLGSGANNVNGNVQFGNGADTLAFNTTGVVTGYYAGGTSGANVFVQDGATIGSPFTLVNFP